MKEMIESIIRGLAKMVSLIEELIGAVNALRQEQEKTNKYLRNYEGSIEAITKEVLAISQASGKIGNSTQLTEINLLRLINHLKTGDDSL